MKKTLTILIGLIVLNSTVSAQRGFWNQVNNGGGGRYNTVFNSRNSSRNDIKIEAIRTTKEIYVFNRQMADNRDQRKSDERITENTINRIPIAPQVNTASRNQDLQKMVEQLLQRIESLEATLSTPPPPQPTLAELVAKLSKAEKMQLMRELAAATK